MTYLLIVTVMLLVACACLMAVVQNWLWFWLALGLIVGLTWLWITEHRWPRRVHVAFLRRRLHNLGHVMDKVSSEMVHLWHVDPGGDEWRALDTWLAELHIERRALRTRIEDLVYKLGREAY